MHRRSFMNVVCALALLCSSAAAFAAPPSRVTFNGVREHLLGVLSGSDWIGVQQSRWTDNEALVFPRGTVVEWTIRGVPEHLRDRLAFAVMRDVRSKNPFDPKSFRDQVIIDHVVHGARTRGDLDVYNKRVYLGRLRFIRSDGSHAHLNAKLLEDLSRGSPEDRLAAAALAQLLKNIRAGDCPSVRATVVPDESFHEFCSSGGGQPEELFLPPGWRITRIDGTVVQGERKLVKAVRVYYADPAGNNEDADGKAYVRHFGTGGPTNQSFRLREGEFITRISLREGRLLDAINWSTNRNRSSGMWGGTGGRAVTEASGSRALRGLRVRYGRGIDAIAFVFGKP